MTPPKPVEWAKVEMFEARGQWVVVDQAGKHIAWPGVGEHWELWDAEARRDTLNASLSPLLARAELAERMAKLLDGLVDVLHELDAVQWENGPPVNWDELVEEAEEAVEEFSSLPKMPEQNVNG